MISVHAGFQWVGRSIAVPDRRAGSHARCRTVPSPDLWTAICFHCGGLDLYAATHGVKRGMVPTFALNHEVADFSTPCPGAASPDWKRRKRLTRRPILATA